MKKLLSMLTVGMLALTSVPSANMVLKTKLTQKVNNLKKEIGINLIKFIFEHQKDKYIDIYIDFNNLVMINGLLKLENINETKKDVNDILNRFPVDLQQQIIDKNLFLKGMSLIICENINHLNDVDDKKGIFVTGIMKNDKTVDWDGCGNQC
ncbi:hypothetical protein [Spiroplasma endosymbiont of Nebria brevicollis]|uniref:hypothetical protein n=1 Tax=Spiroplasma endosymbiont of Nebria brevicollis TaxID=3066284 RepID=UPI00313D816F